VNISLVKESKVSSPEIKTLCDEYIKRSKRYMSISANAGQKALKKSDTFLVTLDENGKNLSSLQWSELLKSKVDDPAVKGLAFIVGGAHGLSDIKQQANLCLRISPMVLSGDIAWLVLHEQIYRALSILNGSKYHHA